MVNKPTTDAHLTQRAVPATLSHTAIAGARKLAAATLSAQRPEMRKDPHTKTSAEDHEQLKDEYVTPIITD